MAECSSLMQPVAREHGVQLTEPAPDACDCLVAADRTRLKQVLLNLLSNAIKHNHPGGRVSLDCVAAGDTVRISVKDTGPGLRAEQCERLFQAFERLDADKAAIEGAGIGLALSKRLVEMMHGTIGVDSEVGVGSTFWIRLAVTAPQRVESALQPEPAGQAAADLAGRWSVLYIEDNPVNVMLMEATLAMQPGLRLLTATLPERGLELASSQHPDLILLDIQLPGMDGYEALRRLRRMEATRATPIIAISANAMQGDVEIGLAAGFTDYLTKPLHVPALLAAVRRALAP